LKKRIHHKGAEVAEANFQYCIPLRPLRRCSKIHILMIQSMRASQFLLILLLCGNLFAQSIRLPLDGYFRPGEYMPVRVETGGEVMLQTDGAMSTRISHAGIAPVFTMSATADTLSIGAKIFPIHVLQPDEKLVGFGGQRDEALAQQIFPNAKIVFVSLDAADPLPGAACAWSSLDAVVLDSLPGNFEDLLSAGMTIAIRSTNPPDQHGGWRQVGDAWVLNPNLFPAHPALLGEDAYLPTESWMPEMPGQLREMIVLIGVLIGCLMLATSLLRARWRLPVLAAVVIVSSVAILIWKNHQSVAVELTGAISHDQWTYQTATRDTEIAMPMDGVVYPVFASPAHAVKLRAVLDADRNEITCQLPGHAMMAFVRRSVGGVESSTANAEQFAPLARRDYLAPGDALRIENNRIVIERVTR
jgi:hypothetical protein